MDLTALLSAKTAIVAAGFAMLLIAERVWPAEQRLGGWPRVGRNGGLLVINMALAPLIVVPLAAWATTWHVGIRPDWWTGAWAIALDLVLLDLWLYGWHRANHRVPFLWRFHEVHHRDRFLDVTTAVRFHAGEVVLSAFARMIPIALLDIPLTSVLLLEGLLLIATGFHHSNLKLPRAFERVLSWLIVTPSIHWVHHHNIVRDTDSNYATVLSCWDRIFRSRSPNPRTRAMPLGVQGEDELSFPRLLIQPFMSRRRAPGPDSAPTR
ncbi:MAG: sterol desaturase family protein [Pseudomonadota bacterium]